MQIKKVSARKIKDSRGEFTIEVSVNGQTASAPSGKSTGKYETPAYHKSIEWNISFINKLNLKGLNIDFFEDLFILNSVIARKAKFKSSLEFGANPLSTLETATLKALAKFQKKQLWQVINPNAKKFPIPVGNVVGGGLHSKSEGKPTFQEFLIIPGTNSIKKNTMLIRKIHSKVGQLLYSKKLNDEGAWESEIDSEGVLEILSKFKNIRLGVDIAASSFYKDGKYFYRDKVLTRSFQILYINHLAKKYNLLYVEDPLQEEDFKGFSRIKKNSKHLVVGDDLTATHTLRLKKALKLNSMNAMIIKPNQNGSLLNLRDIILDCKKNKIKTILSHRSGETMDSAIADIAFAFQTDYIKAGIATPPREIKLDRLVEINEQFN